MPEEWAKQLEAWRERDRALATVEYFLYQTLLGSFPFDEAELDGYARRIKDYVIKAAREAKINTFWQDPNRDYEAALV